MTVFILYGHKRGYHSEKGWHPPMTRFFTVYVTQELGDAEVERIRKEETDGVTEVYYDYFEVKEESVIE